MKFIFEKRFSRFDHIMLIVALVLVINKMFISAMVVIVISAMVSVYMEKRIEKEEQP